MALDNPIQGLYDEYMKIIKGSVIKYSYIADAYETFEMRKYVDGYLDAYYKRDSYDLYTYTEDEFKEIGIEDPVLIHNYLTHPDDVPKIYQNRVLDVRRKFIISSYVEKNEYYRMLNGLPALDDKEFIYVDYDTCEEFGIDPKIPIHLIRSEMGDYYIALLESIGYLDKLIKENPDKEYLNHIGSKRIDIITARHSKNFSILYLDESVTETIRNEFMLLYDQCREYFVTTIYITQYRKIIDYYDRFIGLCIMVMALQQLTARTMQLSFDREFFDSHAVQALYEEYNIPFFPTLDEKTQKAICQNINILIQDKGTNKVIFDIAQLLGYSKIDVYKYYLMKEHKMDKDGNPLFVTKKVFNEETGQEEEVYDYERMFDIYFKKIEVNDYDYHEALEDPGNRVDYDSITYPDPFWIEDAPLYKEVWESEYNYKETKYLGVTVSYKLSEMLYENILLIRLVFDLKPELQSITLKLPALSGSENVTLFDTIVAMCALVSKKYGLGGEIICKPSQVVSVLSDLDRLYNPYETVHETFAFNFDWIKTGEYKETIEEMKTYMSESEIKEFEGYLSILTLNGPGVDKAKAFNQMYSNIKHLAKFLSNKMIDATSIDEYVMYQTFFRATYYARETADAFRLNNGTVPETFIDYLKVMCPTIYTTISMINQNETHIYIDHIISRLETLINDVNHLYIINNATSPLQEVLVALIKFFKSYTTDMIGLNIVYIFDFIPDNIIRLIDEIGLISSTIYSSDSLHADYSDAVSKITTHMTYEDQNMLKDFVIRRINILLDSDDVSLHEFIQVINSMAVKEYNMLKEHIYLRITRLVASFLNIDDTIVYKSIKEEVVDVLEAIEEASIKKKLLINIDDSYVDFISHENNHILYPDFSAFNDEVKIIHSRE